MPLVHFSKQFAVADAKIKKITADPAGGTTTFATAIDIPGIKSVDLTGTVNIKRLRGDNTLLDVNSVLESLSVKYNYAKEQLDARAVYVGGTVSDSGTTPNMVAKWALDNAGVPGYFQFEAKTPTNGVDFVGGDAHLLLYRCMVSNFPGLGFAEEDYKLFEVEADAMPRLSDGKWIDLLFNETAVAIS